jgi:hypothetical protein
MVINTIMAMATAMVVALKKSTILKKRAIISDCSFFLKQSHFTDLF